MLTPDMLLLYRTHADEDDSGFYSIHAVRGLFDHIDAQEARYAALEAAARAIVADCRVHRGDYLGDACRWCDNTIERDGHRPGCPVGVLLPLLEGP
jgi:hypothetical protein